MEELFIPISFDMPSAVRFALRKYFCDQIFEEEKTKNKGIDKKIFSKGKNVEKQEMPFWIKNGHPFNVLDSNGINTIKYINKEQIDIQELIFTRFLNFIKNKF